jgi:hypothetical protein
MTTIMRPGYPMQRIVGRTARLKSYVFNLRTLNPVATSNTPKMMAYIPISHTIANAPAAGQANINTPRIRDINPVKTSIHLSVFRS